MLLAGQLLRGEELMMMPVLDVLDMAWAVLVDGFNGFVNPQEVHSKLEEHFRDIWPDRKTWDEQDTGGDPQAAMIEVEAQATPLTAEEREARRAARDARLGRLARGTPDG